MNGRAEVARLLVGQAEVIERFSGVMGMTRLHDLATKAGATVRVVAMRGGTSVDVSREDFERLCLQEGAV